MRLPAFIAITGLALLPNLTIAQQITNGSFNGFTGDTNSDNNSLPPGWAKLTPPVGQGTPDTIDANSTFFGKWSTSQDGGCFVKCDYGANYPSSGLAYSEGISQFVSGFTIGNIYTLSFEQACVFSSDRNQPGDMGFWQVNIGGTVYNSAQIAIPASGVASPWQTQNIQFLANAATMDIAFSAAGTSNWSRMGIDGVKIVPEPTSASLFGLVGAFFLLHRKRVFDRA